MKYFIHMYENRTMKPDAIILRRGERVEGRTKGGKFDWSAHMQLSQ
jgi:hypothetical protein